MSLSIAQAVAQIKQSVANCLSPAAIEAACRAVGHQWRERQWRPVTTVHAFLTQVLHGNTACEHAVRLADLSCSATAYYQARKLTGKQPQGTTAKYASTRLVNKLGKFEQLVAYRKPPTGPNWMTAEEYAALPETLIVRESRFRTKTKHGRVSEITLLTTLLALEQYPAEELAALFLTRWGVETNFAHLKTTMRMDVLRWKTVEGVLREVHAFALVYNLARLVMIAAAQTQRAPVERMSFVAALRWVALPLPEDQPLKLPLNPYRPNRHEPRVRKRRPKQYPLMKRPRNELRQQLGPTKLTA